MKNRFSKLQSNVLFACMLLYSTAYLNRLNLSAALGSVMEALSLSATRAGVLPSAFAITYAAGQMVNGALVDRMDPARHMIIGLLGSAVCNLLMAVSGSFEVLLVLCLLNGVFQSMLWTPVVCLLAMHFTQQERPRANVFVSIALIAGHLGAWAISGYMSSLFNWRASFAVPAVIAVPVMLIACRLLRGVNSKPAAADKEAREGGSSLRDMLGMYWVSGFVVVLVVSVLYGFVRDGITTWAPQILGEVSGDTTTGTTFSLVIPLINTLGVMLSHLLRNIPGLHNRRIVALMMVISTVFCVCLGGVSGVVLCALCMGLACACLSGVTPILTSLIPMEYEREKLIGLSAGLIDSLIYVGSALAGVTAGFIRESMGLNALFMTWTGVALAAAVLAFVSDGMLRVYRALKWKAE